ncbi:MAG: hypothetical protein HPY53_11545 [Brevinematales bacterium]|nr:hypothetical protein [Brevinematales bacterium]
MKNIIGLSVLVILFSSCGLFFIEGANDKELTPLATTDGGYLSTDDHNEICPFLVRMSSGKAFLFFSSDRNGSYDIFISEMDGNGDFSEPVPLPAPINYADTKELSPVVLDFSPNFYLTFIRVSNTTTNVISYNVSSVGLTNTSAAEYLSASPKGLGMIGSDLLTSMGNGLVIQYYKSTGWFFSSSNIYSKNINSMNGIYFQYTNSDSVELYIEDISEDGMHVLSADGDLLHFIVGFGYTNLLFNISTPDYISKFNDITPFIDHQGGFKVYFASDRYGKKDNFDLYRYNIYTYNTLPEVAQMKTAAGIGKLTVNFPTSNQSFSGGSVTVIVSRMLDNNLSTIKAFCSIGNQPFTNMTQGTDWEFFYSSIPNGAYTVRVYTIDVFYQFSVTNSIPIMVTN